MTNYLRNSILDEIFNNVPFDVTTQFGDVYLSLHTDQSDAVTAAPELDPLTDLGYERCRLYMDTAVDGECYNSAPVSFAATGNWQTFRSMAVYDQLTGGNRLLYTNQVTSKTLSNGDYVAWQAGEFKFDLK